MFDISSYFSGYRMKVEDNSPVIHQKLNGLSVEATVDLVHFTLYLFDTDFQDEVISYSLPALKAEYEPFILTLRDRYFTKSLYLFPQSSRIHEWIEKAYRAKVEFLFKDDPGFGVYRSPSGKWFAGIFSTRYSSFHIAEEGTVEIINLKSDQVGQDCQIPGVYPAWHMNKKYWISVRLDDEVDDKIIQRLIDRSYQLTK